MVFLSAFSQLLKTQWTAIVRIRLNLIPATIILQVSFILLYIYICFFPASKISSLIRIFHLQRSIYAWAINLMHSFSVCNSPSKCIKDISAYVNKTITFKIRFYSYSYIIQLFVTQRKLWRWQNFSNDNSTMQHIYSYKFT